MKEPGVGLGFFVNLELMPVKCYNLVVSEDFERFSALCKIFNRWEEEKSQLNNGVYTLQGKKINLLTRGEIDDVMSNINISLDGSTMHTGKKLFQQKAMGGWCWQMSNFMAALLRADDKVMRGNLVSNYFHGWLEIERFKNDYVFDPAFSVLCKKKDYYKLLQPQIKGGVMAGQIQETLMNVWNDPTARNERLYGGDDVNAPIFRGVYDFSLDVIMDDKIKGVELVAR